MHYYKTRIIKQQPAHFDARLSVWLLTILIGRLEHTERHTRSHTPDPLHYLSAKAIGNKHRAATIRLVKSSVHITHPTSFRVNWARCDWPQPWRIGSPHIARPRASSHEIRSVKIRSDECCEHSWRSRQVLRDRQADISRRSVNGHTLASCS